MRNIAIFAFGYLCFCTAISACGDDDHGDPIYPDDAGTVLRVIELEEKQNE